MRCYDFCSPENDEWCVPATLQTILRSRGIEINQSEIAKSFPEFFEDSVFQGLEFDQELLEEFLREQGLTCGFHNPFTDLFLSEVEGDVIVAYDSKFQQRKETKREQVPHVSIFLDYEVKPDLVKLIDSDISLTLLVRNMHPDRNPDYGFYVIE